MFFSFWGSPIFRPGELVTGRLVFKIDRAGRGRQGRGAGRAPGFPGVVGPPAPPPAGSPARQGRRPSPPSTTLPFHTVFRKHEVLISQEQAWKGC